MQGARLIRLFGGVYDDKLLRTEKLEFFRSPDYENQTDGSIAQWGTYIRYRGCLYEVFGVADYEFGSGDPVFGAKFVMDDKSEQRLEKALERIRKKIEGAKEKGGWSEGFRDGLSFALEALKEAVVEKV